MLFKIKYKLKKMVRNITYIYVLHDIKKIKMYAVRNKPIMKRTTLFNYLNHT